LALVVLLGLVATPAEVQAQETFVERLPAAALDITAPAERVAGELGALRVSSSACPALPLASARRRIVDAAVQEWAYFGFSVTDRTVVRDRAWYLQQFGSRSGSSRSWRRGYTPERIAAFERVAPSIAGYWAATPGGLWAFERQDALWNESGGRYARWRDPWSAAFVSWVLCEGGVGEMAQFERSIAHRTYIDQAIRARDGRAPSSAYVAYDNGEAAVGPGDLLCSGTRSGYTNIDQRRQQLGRGARTHCDIVVAVDEPAEIILAIGGNVYGTVSLKRLPAVREQGPNLHARDSMFAHLKLKAEPIAEDALRTSATVRALTCAEGFTPPSQVEVLGLPLGAAGCGDGGGEGDVGSPPPASGAGAGSAVVPMYGPPAPVFGLDPGSDTGRP
jgi:hypothetical protein